MGDDTGSARRSGALEHRGHAAHFAAVWGSEQVMLPALDVAAPFWTWGAKEVTIDAWHHIVYVAATNAAYELLDRA